MVLAVGDGTDGVTVIHDVLQCHAVKVFGEPLAGGRKQAVKGTFGFVVPHARAAKVGVGATIDGDGAVDQLDDLPHRDTARLVGKSVSSVFAPLRGYDTALRQLSQDLEGEACGNGDRLGDGGRVGQLSSGAEQVGDAKGVVRFYGQADHFCTSRVPHFLLCLYYKR